MNVRPNERPILVIGIERSGSTLLSKILDAHSSIQFLSVRTNLLRKIKNITEPLQENTFNYLFDDTKKFLEEWGKKLSDNEILNIKNYVTKNGYTIRNLQLAIVNTLLKLQEKNRWGEKYDGYGGELEYFMKLFPYGQVILISRDLRDCYASAKMKAKKILLPGSYERGDNLLEFDDFKRMTINWNKFIKSYPNDKWLHIRYEDLVKDPEDTTKKICHFLGIEWSKDMINPDKFLHWGEKWKPNTSFDQKINGIDSNNINRNRQIITEEEMILIYEYGTKYKYDDAISCFYDNKIKIRNNKLNIIDFFSSKRKKSIN